MFWHVILGLLREGRPHPRLRAHDRVQGPLRQTAPLASERTVPHLLPTRRRESLVEVCPSGGTTLRLTGARGASADAGSRTSAPSRMVRALPAPRGGRRREWSVGG